RQLCHLPRLRRLVAPAQDRAAAGGTAAAPEAGLLLVLLAAGPGRWPDRRAPKLPAAAPQPLLGALPARCGARSGRWLRPGTYRGRQRVPGAPANRLWPPGRGSPAPAPVLWRAAFRL